MPHSRHSRVAQTWLRCLVWAALVILSGGCRPRPQKRPSPQRVREILVRGAPFAEGSFYSCLWNGYEQGLPLKQIQSDCETRLAMDEKKGFGPTGRDIVGSFGKKSTYFDPASVSGSCNAGDPEHASGPDGKNRTQKNYADGSHADYGTNSWGGKGKCDGEGCYKGLTEKESGRLKEEAIKASDAAIEAYKEAKFQSEMDPQNAAKKDAADKAKKAAEEALKKANKDPNKVEPKKDGGKKPVSSADNPEPSGAGRPAGPGASPCDEALQAAREILGECQRTGWRSGECQGLWAQLHGCADPTLILVDPESGYSCGDKIDPEAVKAAWVARCRQLHRPVPGGPDPCDPPEVDGGGRFVRGGTPEDLCNSPIALVDPEGPVCLGTVTIGAQFGAPNVQELLVWALNHFGGPIVVLPNRNPTPPPGNGPDPRPGPTP